MDQKDQTVVKLVHPIKGVRSFSRQHAENIMSIPESIRGGWKWFEEEPQDQGTDGAKISGDVVDNSGNKGSRQRRKRSKRNS